MSYLTKLVGLFFLLLLVGCMTGAGIKEGRSSGELHGMVYDLDRQPLESATVTITDRAKSVSVLTDLHGRFGTDEVSFGPVRLEVKKLGFEPFSLDFSFREGSQVLYLQVASPDQLFEKAAVALEAREWQSFRTFLSRAKVLAPQSQQGLILEATALEYQNKIPEAIGLLESYSPESPVLSIELMLGNLYAKQGESGQAQKHWQKALEIREDASVREKMERKEK